MQDSTSGEYYVDANIYSSTADNGLVGFYIPLGDAVISAGKTPAELTTLNLYIQFDIRLRTGHSTAVYAAFAGIFNGDTDDNPNFVKAGTNFSSYRIMPATDNGPVSRTDTTNLTLISGAGTNRLKVHLYYSAGQIVMDVTNYNIDAAYRPGGTTYYATAGPSSGSILKAVAAGNFDNDSADEIAIAPATATSGVYPIRCYNQAATTYFKEINQDVLGCYAKAIAGATVPVGATLGLYERAQGFTSGNYGSTMANWGQCVVVLPSAAQTTARPAFILNADPTNSNKKYLKVTPILK